MSSHSYSTTCPVCEGDMDACTDNRPFDYTTGQCYNCGFTYYTKTDRMSFEEINDQREDQELDVLSQKEYDTHTKEVKKFKEDYF